MWNEYLTTNQHLKTIQVLMVMNLAQWVAIEPERTRLEYETKRTRQILNTNYWMARVSVGEHSTCPAFGA